MPNLRVIKPKHTDARFCFFSVQCKMQGIITFQYIWRQDTVSSGNYITAGSVLYTKVRHGQGTLLQSVLPFYCATAG